MDFESKLKELFKRHVHRANCRKRVKAAQITTKGSTAAIDGLGCCEKPMHWQTATCALNGSWEFTSKCRHTFHW